MPHISVYVPDRDEGRRLKDAMADISAGHGFYTMAGVDATERGNIRELMASIVGGETTTVRLSAEEYQAVIAWLNQHAYQPGVDRVTANGLFTILASLVAARDRANSQE